MQLKILLEKALGLSSNISMEDCSIMGLTLNSKDVVSGDLFFACVGTKSDGRKFIKEAIERGAAAILYEKNFNKNIPIPIILPVPIIPIEHLHEKIGLIAAEFYRRPSEFLEIIGVTGTNGKTSCCHFIAKALHSVGYRTAILGTNGNGLYGHGHLQAASHTTPNPIELQKILADFKTQGANTVAMEVSSHGLDQGRLIGVKFDIAVFTNLTRDHLDYHLSMERYGEAKAKLFKFPDLKYAVINIDDDFGRQLLAKLDSNLTNLKLYAYSAQGRLPDKSIRSIPTVRAQDVHLSIQGMSAAIHTPWGEGVLHSRLLGRFNLSNLLATITSLGIFGIPLSQSLSAVKGLDIVLGRMQVLGGHDNKPHVVIDYAHTPDALRQVLTAVREFCPGEIWCVFGCGGNRDQGKRALMGEVAENLADHIVLTTDNARFENPRDIITDILSGMTQKESVVIELDRERAIHHAISCAKRDDIVLIAGKGHETYQQIQYEKKLFSDYIVAQIILDKKYPKMS